MDTCFPKGSCLRLSFAKNNFATSTNAPMSNISINTAAHTMYVSENEYIVRS